jgi:hypothetical protein
MPSPFPGMDPYIEDAFFWSDFHASMMGAFREALNAVLPDRYTASIERNVWVQETDPHETTLVGVPDVQVANREQGPAAGGGQAAATLTVTAPQPVTLPLVRRPGPRYLRITDRRRRQVVTVIELLSPANKTTTGYGVVYRQKRLDYLAGGVNLVEIDLLRAGTRPPVQEPPPAPSDYYLLVCPAESFPQAGYWPLSVRDPLPALPIPLAPGEAPSHLNLRDCLDQVYKAGRYERELDYTEPPIPPLREPDATWARGLVDAFLAQRQ